MEESRIFAVLTRGRAAKRAALLTFVATAIAAVVLAAPSTAFATSCVATPGSCQEGGNVLYPGGFYANGATIYIHNNTTGADGSTVTYTPPSNTAIYGFTGLVVGDSYYIYAVIIPNCTESYSNHYNFTYSGTYVQINPVLSNTTRVC